MKRFYFTDLPQAHKHFHITRCKRKSELYCSTYSTTLDSSSLESSTLDTVDLNMNAMILNDEKIHLNVRSIIRGLIHVLALYKEEKQWYFIEDKIRSISENSISKKQTSNDTLSCISELWIQTSSLIQESKQKIYGKDAISVEWYMKINRVFKELESLQMKIERYTNNVLSQSSNCSESELSTSSSLSESLSSEDEDIARRDRMPLRNSTNSFNSFDTTQSSHSSNHSSQNLNASHSTNTSHSSNSSQAIHYDISFQNDDIKLTQYIPILNMIINVLLGDLKKIQNLKKEALEYYKCAHESIPEFSLPTFRMAQLQFKLGDLNSALENYNQSIDKLPSNYQDIEEAYYQRGCIQKEKEFIEESLKDITMAISIKPQSKYYDARAKLYRLQGDFINAIQDYSKSIELNPTQSHAYLERGLIRYENENNHMEAHADFSKAIEFGSKSNMLPYVYRGDINRIFLNNLIMALYDYNQAVELADEKSKPSILVSRALLHDMMNHPDECLSDLDNSIALDSKNIETLLIRSSHHFQHSRFHEALQDVITILDIQPNHLEALIRKLDLYEFYIKDLPQALHCADQLIHLDPHNPVHYSRKDNLMAIAFYQQFVPIHF